MTAITLTGLTKRFGATTAVDGIDLTISAGDLFFLLGPSGCGKTTLLRMIAGFIAPTAGSIRFGNRDVTRLPPNKRNTGMVFQSYALWPHMTVFDNVAFGLGVRKVDAATTRERVERALAMVRMEPYARRRPNQLSGGQQQRVSLARALVIEPDLLLLDEPLSNLDAKLRLEMRDEIRRICSELKITTVYVTHDQKEALSMADDIAVLRDGRMIQRGDPRDLYQRPTSRFVADFLGETNFIPGVVLEADADANGDTHVVLETPAGRLDTAAFDLDTPAGGNVTCSIRPEALRIVPASTVGRNVLTGTRRSSMYLGDVAQHIVELPDGVRVKVLELNPPPFDPPGEPVHLTVAPADVVILGD